MDGTNTTAHRAAYRLFVRPISNEIEIDHLITCSRHCVNFVAHLRAVTVKQNQENRGGASAVSTSGLLDVHWESSRQRWRVVVHHNGVNHWGGRFADKIEAEQAAIALRCALFTHNDRDRSLTRACS